MKIKEVGELILKGIDSALDEAKDKILELAKSEIDNTKFVSYSHLAIIRSWSFSLSNLANESLELAGRVISPERRLNLITVSFFMLNSNGYYLKYYNTKGVHSTPLIQINKTFIKNFLRLPALH